MFAEYVQHTLGGGSRYNGPVNEPLIWGWGVTGGVGLDYTVPFFHRHVAVRIIHACGMVEITSDIAMSNDFAAMARDALKRGAPILCDAKMVAQGITRPRLPANNEIICTLDHPEVPALAVRRS